MLSKTPFVKLCGLVGKSRFAFAFKKFDFEDGLNLKSLLTEEEVMVIKMLYIGHGKCSSVCENSPRTKSYCG